jgi:hypothetical protein
MQEIGMQPQVESTATAYRNTMRYTNFYPLYGGANDQVDPVSRVQPVLFQGVIPSYRLSTSETRDLGVGPMFKEGPSASSPGIREMENSGDSQSVLHNPGVSTPEPTVRAAELEPWKGSQVDLFA